MIYTEHEGSFVKVRLMKIVYLNLISSFFLKKIMSEKQPYIIGITGGSASGKTFFLNDLLQQFKEEEVCLISQDNYRTKDRVPVDENGVQNYGYGHY
jgi:pantothenate kinase-related protein Tda10